MSVTKSPILPGAAVGVLGSGQLGRMFAIAARRMGYRVHTFSPDNDTPTGQVSDREVTARYDDIDAVREFARRVSVVTFEFENVPATTAAACAEIVPVRPAGAVLHVTQNRLREKAFLRDHGFPLSGFRHIRHESDFGNDAVGILKTSGFGYDGKGQARILDPAQAPVAWSKIGHADAILEEFIDFECELSVVAARGADGSFAHYGAVRNEHRNHILDVTIAPAPIPEKLANEAAEIARAVLEALDVVGVLCVEFFLTRDGRLLINELAPRPHNSGHFTFDANVTSQFEQQLRSVCGLPLGSTEQLRPAAMANLLGDVWSHGTPNWAAALADSRVKLHLYGKTDPRAGRKMGHLTALADSAEEAAKAVIAARERLAGPR